MDITYHMLDSNIALVRLNGRLDALTSPNVKAVLQGLLDKEGLKVIVDLEQVPFIDSSGLVSLVSGVRLARQQGGDIILSGLQPQAQTVFRLTMLDRVFSIHPTFADAERSLL